jgi:hypothetical protein
MHKIKDVFRCNDNIDICTDEEGVITFELIPYNEEITFDSVMVFLANIYRHSDKIKEANEVDSIVISLPSGYFVDGLSETNDLLLTKDSVVGSMYHDEEIKLSEVL